MHQRWLDDENLPTWAHTALIYVIASPFAIGLAWPGAKAIVMKVLPPMMGPDFGTYIFGDRELHGSQAVMTGWSLVFLGISVFLVASTFTRWSQDHWLRKIAPWLIFIASCGFFAYVGRLDP